MTRNRASAKAAGTRFESAVVAYLQEHVSEWVERRARNGNRDRGDISGLQVHGQRVVAECKDYGGRIEAAMWTGEAEIERGNDDAIAGLVVVKRKGDAHVGRQYVLMTVDDLAALLTGHRPPAQ